MKDAYPVGPWQTFISDGSGMGLGIHDEPEYQV
jgi:hypothetical protein